MKIKHLLLWLLLALCTFWNAKAQETTVYYLTLHDGISRNDVPFQCSKVSMGTNSQFILPEGEISTMRGKKISKLTFFNFSSSGNFGSATFSVYMAEVSESMFSAPVLFDWDSMTEVYTGSLTINNYMMTITLDNAYSYNGGNLMIGFKEVNPGNDLVGYYYVWRGADTENYTSLTSNIYPNYVEPYNRRFRFLPKMIIEFFALNLPMVDVTMGDITPNTASFSWSAPSSEVTGYKYQCYKASESFVDNWIPITDTLVTLEGLDPVTNYVFCIKACYGELESDMTAVDFKTTCLDYATIPFYEDFESYAVQNGMSPENRTLPDCWDYINVSENPYDSVFPTVLTYSGNSFAYAYQSYNSMAMFIDNTSSDHEPKPQYIILPAMHNINRLRLKFYTRSYSATGMFSGKFKVGVMEETENGPEFIQIGKTFDPDIHYQLKTIDFTSYEGDGEHIVIWMEAPSCNYGCVFIDNIVVEELPNFTKPIASYGETWGNWYLISSPLADETPIENIVQYENTNANEPGFDLYRFNPSPVNPGIYWENWKSHANNEDHYHFNLKPGRGYLYANAADVTLNFAGTPYSGNGEVTLLYDENEHWGGWNLVGNPFPVSAYIGDRNYLRMNEEGTGFVPATVGTAIEAMEGIFVYTEDNGEVLTFSTTQPTRSNEQLSLNVSKITRAGLNTTIDRAILNFGEGNRLPKFQLDENSAKVYIPQNGLDYAVVATEGQGEMPVNFRADENGTYTLSFSCENVEFSYLHLFDNKTGNDVDLLSTPSYTFDATTTDYESRFKLVYATGSSVAGDSFSFFNSNGNFSIFGIEGEATLQVLDVMGRMLSTETFSGSIEKRLDVAPGVYFIRLVNGDDVKTQKIIVR